MTLSVQFKKDVAHGGTFGKFKSAGRITFITAALEAYEQAQTQNMPELQQLSYLYEVHKQCKKWLATKATKTSAKSLTRQIHVKKLMGEVPGEMALRFPSMYEALTTFESRKAKPLQGQTAKTQGVYAHESSVYASNKAAGKYADPTAARFTASATLFHSEMHLMEQKTHVAHRRFMKSDLKGPISNGTLAFDSLTEAQYRKIDELCQGQFNVLYLSKIQRLQYMVIVENGELKHPDGKLITLIPGATVLDELNRCPYAMDKYGNLFVTKESDHKGVQINHTTLCAGNEVLCAGTISIKNGELRAISNNSGHYKPNTQHLAQVLTALMEAEVAMEGVVVVDKAQGNLETTAKLFMAGNYNAQPNLRVDALLQKTS